jgi:hypothetical protein
MSLCVICDSRRAGDSNLCSTCERELDDYRMDMDSDFWEGAPND